MLAIAATLALLACASTIPLALATGAKAPARAAQAGAVGARAAAEAPARAARSSLLTGIGDDGTEMFTDPKWTQLHIKIARYVVPYDAAVRPYSLTLARQWIGAAEAAHQQILIAFYHSEYTPTKMPSVAAYKADVAKFLALFPRIHQYEAYDEANRGNVKGSFSSPSATLNAQYYQALLSVCHGCTVIGLDVLDAQVISPTVRYIAEFRHEVEKLHVAMPKIWGLHNYSDVNRFESWRTRTLVAALGGQVWLTETGGIVKLPNSFLNINGSGLTRAAKVLKFTFALARATPQIARMYLYDWTGAAANARFDAGLTDIHNNPRPGYLVVCKELHAAKCNMKVSNR
jgi:hypothetical protein